MAQRWNKTTMIDRAHWLFKTIHRKKRLANPNHEIHGLARKLNDWIPESVDSLLTGIYFPRCLKRHYFENEVVDTLYLPDRMMQNLILHELKPTFSAVMSKNCLHLNGPHGVKLAYNRICDVLKHEQPTYVIRADIKSYYASIPHYRLIQDIKKLYDDTRVQRLLERVIRNPLETKCGYKNPDHGITLRGPLSQFFSRIYLKPLDNAFETMAVTYIRYQDDILIFCKTKCQLNRCKRRMMEVLRERQLKLSRKKSRIGRVDEGFHFLGVNYPALQEPNNQKLDDAALSRTDHDFLKINGFGTQPQNHTIEIMRNVPHARTLRNAREQVRVMIYYGISTQHIRHYLSSWARWWTLTIESWSYPEIFARLIDSCWDTNLHVAAMAEGLRQRYLKKIEGAA